MENKKTKGKIQYIIPALIIGILIFVDQITKYLISSNFHLSESKPIIKNVFELCYVRNEGMAWGMFAGKRIIFLILTILIVIMGLLLFVKIRESKKFLPIRICIIVLISGAIGNMIDRIRFGYVIDFFYFKPIDFPVFNVADIYVVLSMITLFILLIFVYSNDDFDELFGAKKNDK